MNLTRISVAALCLFAAATAFAEVSKQYADFPTGFAQYLLTDAEREEWKNVRTDEQAKQFIDLFWARRDPTPATPANELRALIEARVEAADEQLDHGRIDGSRTDRGKVFVALGSPTSIRRSGGAARRNAALPPTGDDGGTSATGLLPRTEVWHYEDEKTELQLGQPELQITFVDVNNVGEYRLGGRTRDAVKAVERVAQSYISQPNLTAVPSYTAAQQAAAPAATPAAPAAPAASPLTTPALREAITAVRAEGAKKSDALFVSHGEFITPDGAHFVPVQVYAPASAGLTGGQKVTFFGTIEKAEGGEVISIEEPVELTATTGGVFHARSLGLAPGRYRGFFGLAKDGTPISVASTDLVIEGLKPGEPSASPLILSNHVYPMTEAQAPTDPFAFGGLQIVPKSDATFRKTDELWYFVELRNPGLDPATREPRLSVKLAVNGTADDGKPVRMVGAPEITPGQELKGVPGHRAIGQALPLANFRPGNYTMTVTVKDLTLDKTFKLEAPFRVAEDE